MNSTDRINELVSFTMTEFEANGVMGGVVKALKAGQYSRREVVENFRRIAAKAARMEKECGYTSHEIYAAAVRLKEYYMD